MPIDSSLMERRHIDLRKLPAWQRYPLAVAVVALVLLIVHLTGPRDPPAWLTRNLVRVLGCVYLLLLGWRLFRRRRKRP